MGKNFIWQVDYDCLSCYQNIRNVLHNYLYNRRFAFQIKSIRRLICNKMKEKLVVIPFNLNVLRMLFSPCIRNKRLTRFVKINDFDHSETHYTHFQCYVHSIACRKTLKDDVKRWMSKD